MSTDGGAQAGARTERVMLEEVLDWCHDLSGTVEQDEEIEQVRAWVDALAAQVAALTEQLAAQQRQTAMLTSEITRAQAHWDALDQQVGALTEREHLWRTAIAQIAQSAHGAHGGLGSFRWCGETCCHMAYALEQGMDILAATTPPAGDDQATIERDLAAAGYQRTENQHWTIWHGPPDADGRAVELVFPRHGSTAETRRYVQKARAALAAFGPVTPPAGAQETDRWTKND